MSAVRCALLAALALGGCKPPDCHDDTDTPRCTPGEIECLGSGHVRTCLDDGDWHVSEVGSQIRTCGDDGLWDEPEVFFCSAGSCHIVMGIPVCQ